MLYYGSVKHCKSIKTTFLVLHLFRDRSSETSLSASWRLVAKIQRWLICWGWFMKGHFKSGGEMLSSLETILVNLISLLVIYLFINRGCWCEIRSHKRTKDVLYQVNGARSERLWRCCSVLEKTIVKNWMLDASDRVQLQSRGSFFPPSETSFYCMQASNNHVRSGWLKRWAAFLWRFPLRVSCWEVKHAASQDGHPSVQLRTIRSSPAAAAVFISVPRVCVCPCHVFSAF